MRKEKAKDLIRKSPGHFLNKDKSGKGYECPLCHSGTGPKGTGLTTKDGTHYSCWAGCFTNWDIIDIIGTRDKIRGYEARLCHCANLMGISIDGGPGSKARKASIAPISNTIDKEIDKEIDIDIDKAIYKNQVEDNGQDLKVEEQVDYTAFFVEAAKALENTNYRRGLSDTTLARFNVGYVEEWRHPKAPKDTPTSPRLIIPTSNFSYVARDTRMFLPEEYLKYAKSKVGSTHIFNEQALFNSTWPIFIVEGEIDAMSIEEVGGTAIGLGGVGAVAKLLRKFKDKEIIPTQPLIVALDKDTPGKKAALTLMGGLEHLGVFYTEADICLGCKDPNEALNKDRDTFSRAVSEAIEAARCAYAEKKDNDLEELQHEAVAYSLDEFLHRVEASKNRAYYPTLFSELDEALDGGLYAGLYIIGAISSLGKTTFCLQVADQLASTGNDVLIFSLEMARDELIAKSISRLTYQLATKGGQDSKNAKTTRGILTGSRYEKYSQAEIGLINKAIEVYKGYSARLYITEGIGNVGVGYIRDKVEKYHSVTGRAPIVIIDYLQILAPADPRATDKQNTDRAVLELKKLSRDYSIPIIGISSFNRENYLAPVNLASFKESGAIEYSSDVLIGLQYEGMDYDKDRGDNKEGTRIQNVREVREAAEKAAKDGTAQDIQVKILKNRNGRRGSVSLKYLPMFNYFLEEKRPRVIDGPGQLL